METIETIISGALGALTFGMYWRYISMKQMEEHNRKIDEMWRTKRHQRGSAVGFSPHTRETKSFARTTKGLRDEVLYGLVLYMKPHTLLTCFLVCVYIKFYSILFLKLIYHFRHVF